MFFVLREVAIGCVLTQEQTSSAWFSNPIRTRKEESEMSKKASGIKTQLLRKILRDVSGPRNLTKASRWNQRFPKPVPRIPALFKVGLTGNHFSSLCGSHLISFSHPLFSLQRDCYIRSIGGLDWVFTQRWEGIKDRLPLCPVSVNNFYFLSLLSSIRCWTGPLRKPLFSCLQPGLTQSNAHFWQKEIKFAFVNFHAFPIDEKLILKICALSGIKAWAMADRNLVSEGIYLGDDNVRTIIAEVQRARGKELATWSFHIERRGLIRELWMGHQVPILSGKYVLVFREMKVRWVNGQRRAGLDKVPSTADVVHFVCVWLQLQWFRQQQIESNWSKMAAPLVCCPQEEMVLVGPFEEENLTQVCSSRCPNLNQCLERNPRERPCVCVCVCVRVCVLRVLLTAHTLSFSSCVVTDSCLGQGECLRILFKILLWKSRQNPNLSHDSFNTVAFDVCLLWQCLM